MTKQEKRTEVWETEPVYIKQIKCQTLTYHIIITLNVNNLQHIKQSLAE